MPDGPSAYSRALLAAFSITPLAEARIERVKDRVFNLMVQRANFNNGDNSAVGGAFQLGAADAAP